MKILFRFALTGLALSLACSDKSPTGPEASSTSSRTVEESRLAIRPSRSAPRAIAPRPVSTPSHVLQIGNWGTTQSSGLDNRLLTVTATGAMLRSECSNGVIRGTMPLDDAGRFDVLGTYQIQAGPAGLPRPARYVGFASGSTITFTVVPTEDNQTFGPFTLTLGHVPRIGYCPIL